MIAALILAGSAGPREKVPLALTPIPRLPAVAEQWLALRTVGLDPLRIAVGSGVDRIAGGSGLARENFVADPARRNTPFSELQAGLRALLRADDWQAVVVQPVTATPPHPAVILALVERFAEGDAGVVVPSHRLEDGFPILLGRDAAEAFLDLDPARATLAEVVASLLDAGAAARLEVYTRDVLGVAVHVGGSRRARRKPAVPAPPGKGRRTRRTPGRGRP